MAIGQSQSHRSKRGAAGKSLLYHYQHLGTGKPFRCIMLQHAAKQILHFIQHYNANLRYIRNVRWKLQRANIEILNGVNHANSTP